MRTRSVSALPSLLVLTSIVGCAVETASPSPAPLIDPAKVIDLTYPFGPDTIYWPTAEPFVLRRVAYGRTDKGYFYAANNLSMAEHGGTHMDAPIHFAEGRMTAADVPLSSCIGPAVVIDVATSAARDADYRLIVGDVEMFEAAHGRTDVPLDTANLHFPGYSREAAELLVNQRDVAALATDTASIDHGPSSDFIAHQVLNGANKPGFENLANTDRLPATGAWIVALPLKIQDGTGGPARVIAVVP
jgi:kynurenine formamidase